MRGSILNKFKPANRTSTHFVKFEEHMAGKVMKVSHKMVVKSFADCSNVIVTGQNYVQGKILNLKRLILCFLRFLGLVGDKGNKDSTWIKKFNLCFSSPCFLLFS